MKFEVRSHEVQLEEVPKQVLQLASHNSQVWLEETYKLICGHVEEQVELKRTLPATQVRQLVVVLEHELHGD